MQKIVYIQYFFPDFIVLAEIFSAYFQNNFTVWIE